MKAYNQTKESRYADGNFTEVFDENTKWQIAAPLGKKHGAAKASAADDRAGRNDAAASAGGDAGLQVIDSKQPNASEHSADDWHAGPASEEAENIDRKRNRQRKSRKPKDDAMLYIIDCCLLRTNGVKNLPVPLCGVTL